MDAAADLPICVIIAAWTAEATIARAVASALAQAQVREVVVIDDASPDATVAAARGADDASGRLRVIGSAINAGPAAARNRAIAETSAPLIAILDADDFFLPDRFAPMLAQSDWDAIADNVAFVDEGALDAFDPEQILPLTPSPSTIGLAAFIDGNIPRRGRSRGEIGFAKPVIRRDFLTRQGLSYDPTMRLGEDYALYARLIARGGRFVRIRSCGYVAVERPRSLSGQHATHDLEMLLRSNETFARDFGLPADARDALRRHSAQLADRLHLRRILDIRRARGRGRAIGAALAAPVRLPALISAVVRDKRARSSIAVSPKPLRYLFD